MQDVCKVADLDGKDSRKLTAQIPQELVDWMDRGIRKHRFASYTHAIVNALQEMKDREDTDS